ncbi:MAG TPA: D-alanyl-D-alanine endopeptidase [Oxalicibacterium sp.]|jgi:D-alanyl-D-alanine endopeptidase (penicillin-binding protein 7)|nr:D-alanyl-D-alanine endopeptidase [Oxalicibacterium sp.]
MLKSALGIALSFLIFFHIPYAQAAETAGTSAKSKTVKTTVKKTTKHSAKRKSTSVASRRGVSTPTRKKSRAMQAASLNSREKLVKKVVIVHGKRKVVYQREAKAVIPAVPPVMTAGDLAGLNMTRDSLALASNVALVMDESSSQVLFEKNANVALPIASITKLMTGMVVVESGQDMNEIIQVTDDDVDRLRFSSSRLRVGSKLPRSKMLHIALMSSENRAASALGRNYPGGIHAFVAAMNAKARELGMTSTHYVDSTGLSSQNVASARDLAKLLLAASHHPILCQYTTDTKYVVEPGGRALQYANSNRLVNNPDWEIGIQKTGFINEAGHCLVMQANIDGRSVVMIFLDSKGKYSRLADAKRIRKWLEKSPVSQSIAANTHRVEG